MATLAAVLALAACGTENAGQDPSSSATPSATDTATSAPADAGACTPAGTEMPAIAGDYGTAPTFTWPEGCAPADLQVDVLVEGDGPEVNPSAAVVAHYVGYVWGTDTPFDSSYDRGAPSMFSLNQVVAGWSAGIPTHTVGSRLLISVPPAMGYGEAGQPSAGIGGTDTIVFVVDLVAAYNTDTAGQADATAVDNPDLPVTVDGALGAPATLTVNADALEPTEPASFVIATGTGAPITAGQSVAVNYTVTYWDGTGTTSSWSPDFSGATQDLNPSVGPLVAQMGGGTIFDQLMDLPVGSRVVLLLPASDGSAAIAVVADILGSA